MSQRQDSSDGADVLVGAEPLTRLCAAILNAAGCGEEESHRIAAPLVEANLTGHDSHGVSRIPRYVESIGEGLVRPGVALSVESDTGTLLSLDGNLGFGQIVGHDAIDLACERAQAAGVTVMALKNAGHLGRIGAYAVQAAEKGLVSIHFVNVRGRSLVAPYGSRERRMSTSPFCAGAPIRGAPPIVLDFATSKVAEGKAYVALKKGVPLPEGALISATGTPSADPLDLYGDSASEAVPDAARGPGALAVFGDHKGSGLNFMIEVLAGALTGGGVNRTLLDGDEPLFHNGMLSILLDPERFAGRAAFEQQVRAYIDYVKSARPAEGHEAVLVPGDVENARRAERLRAGIPLDGSTWADLRGLAERLGRADAVPAVKAP